MYSHVLRYIDLCRFMDLFVNKSHETSFVLVFLLFHCYNQLYTTSDEKRVWWPRHYYYYAVWRVKMNHSFLVLQQSMINTRRPVTVGFHPMFSLSYFNSLVWSEFIHNKHFRDFKVFALLPFIDFSWQDIKWNPNIFMKDFTDSKLNVFIIKFAFPIVYSNNGLFSQII